MDRMSPQANATGGPPQKRRCVSSPSANSPRELGQMRSHRDTGSGSAHFVGSGSGIHFVHTVRHAFANNSLKKTAPELVPGEDDQLDPPSSLWRTEELRPLETAFEGIRCSFDDLVLGSKSYFDSWHPPFPFLHAPSVLGILEKLSTNGIEGLDQCESIVVRSIMSISLADRRQLLDNGGFIVPSQLVFQTTDEAILAIQPLIVRPSTLPNLQAVVSVQLFLISMLRLNAASRIGGLVVRMALHLGLHRCPARFEQFSKAEVEIRRRLFWSIYSIDRYLSQSLGLPLDLKDDDLDVCYHDDENHLPSTTEAFDLSSSSHLMLSTFLAKHGRIKGLILELRNKSILHSNFDPDEQAYIDAEISKWWNAAQDLVDPIDLDLNLNQFRDASQPPLMHLKPSHRLLLIVQKHESVILLNRPVITSGYKTSAFAAAMQKCIGAAKAIITNVFRHISSSMDLGGTSAGRIASPLVWPGFVWMVWQSGLILLYAASGGYYSIDVAQREASRCVAILEHLSLRGTFWPSSCAAAIKELQSALKENFSRNSSSMPSHTVSDTPLNFSNTLTRGTRQIGNGRNAPPSNHIDGMDRVESVPGSVGAEQQSPSQHQILQESESPLQSTNQQKTFSANSISQYQSHDTVSNSGSTILAQPQLHSSLGDFSNSTVLGDVESWENTYASLGLDNYGDQSYDIFQLMDPSYLLNGQITPSFSQNFGSGEHH